MKKMKICFDAVTDKGIVKKTNEDNILVKISSINDEQIGLFVVCDGVGGLNKGDLASAFAIEELTKWWNEKLLDIFYEEDLELVTEFVNRKLQDINTIIKQYGDNNQLRLGTTISALLIKSDFYIISNVGDSRIYTLSNKLIKLTEDHSLVNKLLKEGKLTEEEAKTFNRKNVITECLGAKSTFEIYNNFGYLKDKEVFLLASDGFYEKIKENEKKNILRSFKSTEIKGSLEKYVNLLKNRGETDNISAILVTCKEGKISIAKKISNLIRN